MMENMFSAYMPTTILQYYTHPCEINKNSKFKSEQITLINPLFTLVKNLVKNLLRRNRKKNGGSVIGQDLVLRNTGVRSKQLKSWINFLLPVQLNDRVLSNIKEFNPTVIYTQAYSYTMLKYVNKLSKKLSCPVVVHTLDNWMETQYKKDVFSAIPIAAFNNLFKSILNNGMNHMVASPKMEEFMHKKYGGNYTFVINCCRYPPYKCNNKSQIMKVVYTGGLMLERYLILDEIAKCINMLNSENVRFELHIYAPLSHIQGYKDLMQREIIFHESVKHEEVFNILTESDILVHVESFNPNVIKFTKYSLSTKIPEYIAAARPLIYFGPINTGVAEFLFENKIGISVDSIKGLEQQLLLLYQDDEYYEAVAFEAYSKGKGYFDIKVMQSQINRCLKSRSEL